MSHSGIPGTDVHCRYGVGTGLGVQHQGLTGNRRFGFLRLFGHNHAAAEGADTTVLADGTGIHVGAGVGCRMDNLGSGIQILPSAGKGYTGKFHPCALPLQDTHGIETAYMGTEGTGNPLNRAALFHRGTFGVEVVHVF